MANTTPIREVIVVWSRGSGRCRIGRERNDGLPHPLRRPLELQPLKAGTTGSREAAVVVVDGSAGPVKEITSVSFAIAVFVEPTATHSDALTHDTEESRSSTLPALGLGMTTAESTSAPAGVNATTQAITNAKTENIARSDLRVI